MLPSSPRKQTLPPIKGREPARGTTLVIPARGPLSADSLTGDRLPGYRQGSGPD